jgi:hypothetical protein
MRGRVATTVFGILLSLYAGGSIAWADDAKFRFTNSTPETIYLNLFSRARHLNWPGPKRHWVLNPGQEGTVAAGACQPNEKICFGGGNKKSSRYWGDGLDGKKGCANCCIQCGGSNAWTLTEHSDPPPRPHAATIDDGPALVPADD